MKYEKDIKKLLVGGKSEEIAVNISADIDSNFGGRVGQLRTIYLTDDNIFYSTTALL